MSNKHPVSWFLIIVINILAGTKSPVIPVKAELQNVIRKPSDEMKMPIRYLFHNDVTCAVK